MSDDAAIGILGTGLIGASIGLRARELKRHVIGYDAYEPNAQAALTAGALNAIASRDEIYSGCETIVLCTPVSAICEELRRLPRTKQPSASLLMDVGSVKAPVVREADGLHRFVASHPMAGKERSGPAAASAALFVDRPWLYVPAADLAVNARAIMFIQLLGAQPVPIEAAEHDRIVACTSHLPQAIANLFAQRIQSLQTSEALEQYYGPAARELLRLSGSDIAMWRDIFRENRENIACELRALAAQANRAADVLDRDDGSWPLQ